MIGMSTGASLPTDLASAYAMILAQRAALLEAHAEAQHRALLIGKLRFTIAKLRHERFGQSSERGAILEQLELQLADLEENAAEVETAARSRPGDDNGEERQAAQAGASAAARAAAARADRLSGAHGL